MFFLVGSMFPLEAGCPIAFCKFFSSSFWISKNLVWTRHRKVRVPAKLADKAGAGMTRLVPCIKKRRKLWQFLSIWNKPMSEWLLWELSHLSRVAESWNSLPHVLQTYQPLKLQKCYHLKKLFYHTSISPLLFNITVLTYEKKEMSTRAVCMKETQRSWSGSKSGLRIRISFIRIRIQSFNYQKLKKNYSWKKN